MKNRSLIFAVIITLLPVTLSAQDSMFRSKLVQELQRKSAKTLFKSYWNNGGNVLMGIVVMSDKDARNDIGISDEQQKQIQTAMGAVGQNEETKKIQKEINELQGEKDFWTEKGDPEKQKRWLELQEKNLNRVFENIPAAVNSSFTPEQKKKLQKFQLSMMGELPLVNTQMFNALDLSEEQQKKADGIKKELEPKFEQLMTQLIDKQIKLQEKVWERIDKEGGIQNGNWGRVGELSKQLAAEDPELRKLTEEMQTATQLFVTQLKYKMFDILTDEQLAQLEQIVNNPPEYVKKFVKNVKTGLGQSDSSGAANDFLNSWKPGEPIPAEYKNQRSSKKFPGKE